MICKDHPPRKFVPTFAAKFRFQLLLFCRNCVMIILALDERGMLM